MRRVMVIGNGGGGKTLLARRLGEAQGLPVHHVDSIQFRPGWERAPLEESDRTLDAIAAGPAWVIDGFGSRACIERRMAAADTVVLVDLPLAVHYWRALGRQLRAGRRPRSELPEGCPEDSLAHTWWLVKVMWRVHRELLPWLRAQVRAAGPRGVHLRSRTALEAFARRHAGGSLATAARAVRAVPEDGTERTSD